MRRSIEFKTFLAVPLALAALAAQLRAAETAAPAAAGIELRDSDGNVLAKAKGSLNVEREYRPGDRIRLAGPACLVVQLDQRLPEAMICAPKGLVEFPLPVEPGQRAVYPPGSFAGGRHLVTARAASGDEVSAYRNVALNPLDVRGETAFYPHATSNSECRDDPSFAARNAIDGRTENKGHGATHPSWGPDQRTDLWWKVEFGRSVRIDKVVLSIRADFPHDRHWRRATIEFSDGSRETIAIEKKAESQTFAFSQRTVDWLRITDLIQDEPLGWCGFTEVEVWGRDAASDTSRVLPPSVEHVSNVPARSSQR